MSQASGVCYWLHTPQRPSPLHFTEEAARLRQQVWPARGHRAVGQLGPGPGLSAAGSPPLAVTASFKGLGPFRKRTLPLARGHAGSRAVLLRVDSQLGRGWKVGGQERPGHQKSLAARGPHFPGSADPQPPEFYMMGRCQAPGRPMHPGWPASESSVLTDLGTGLF